MTDKKTKVLSVDEIMENAKNSADSFRKLNQEQTDRIVKAVYEAGFNNRVKLAKLACDETRLGVWEDKVMKNVIATRYVYHDIKNLKTVGAILEDKEHEVVEIAEPLGPIFALTPITNPTSTVLFKILISLKTRNPIVIRPHGAARKCSIEAARLCYDAALKVGAPDHCIQWVKRSSNEQTREYMSHRKTALVLATGSVNLVREAYRSGNPAIGVGPGNVPVYIGKTADVPFAVEQIFISKTFDNGTVCASEQALIANRDNVDEVINEFKKRKAYFLSKDEIKLLEKVAYNKEQMVMNAGVVGQPAPVIAKMAGFDVSPDTNLLIAELDDVGLKSPLSLEILAPILAFYIADEFEQAIEMCRRINMHGGMGHTVSIFSNDEDKIEYFASVMNAGRILVNTPASHGALGGTYNALRPSLVLACGTGGKNITTDNISAKHLLNIHRVARRKVSDSFVCDHYNYLDETKDVQSVDKEHT
jgi:acetaldehyde dehydrogenase/alcohol dehydrogenase